MRLKEISIQFYPPKLIVLVAIDSVEELIEFPIPVQENSARGIYNYLVSKNALFALYKKETKYFSKYLASAQLCPYKFKPKAIVQPHFAPVIQIGYSRQNRCFVSLSADCSAQIYYCDGYNKVLIELPARPTCFAEDGAILAFGFLNGSVLLCDFTGVPVYTFTLQSAVTGLSFVRDSAAGKLSQENSETKCLLITLFDGRVVCARIHSEGAVFSTEITYIAKHSLPAVFASYISAHRFSTAGFDGILAFHDTRRAASRLSAHSKATFFAKETAITAVAKTEHILCIGFASGEWRGVQIGYQGQKMIFEGFEKRAISACALSCDESLVCVAVVGKIVIVNILSYTRLEVEVGGEVRQLAFLNPRDHYKVAIAADKLTIFNLQKKNKQEFDCGKIGHFAASYDGKTICVGNLQGELHFIEGE